MTGTIPAAIGDDRGIMLSLNTGEKLGGILHASVTLSEARNLVGRMLDLEGAYRQLTVAPESAWASVVEVFTHGEAGEAARRHGGPSLLSHCVGIRLQSVCVRAAVHRA